jgi:hypothetical protein
MQIIYAAPFVFLSVLGFAICLAIPRLRRHALPALVVPVVFGGCSIVGWIAFILVSDSILKINLGATSGLPGVMEGLAFYIVPGLLGAWFATWLVRLSEQCLFASANARSLILAVAAAAVCAGIGGIAGLGLASRLLPVESGPAAIVRIGLGASLMSALVGFKTARMLKV